MTREEAIIHLTEARKYPVAYTLEEQEAYEMAIAALREQETVTDSHQFETVTNRNGLDWISVEERLPEIYQTVLAYRENLSNPGGYMTMEYITRAYGNANQWSNDLNTWKSKVTHWMPLPEPPEVEG